MLSHSGLLSSVCVVTREGFDVIVFAIQCPQITAYDPSGLCLDLWNSMKMSFFSKCESG